MKFLKKYKSELLLGGGAILAGLISFFITLGVYPIVRTDNGNVKEKQILLNDVGGGDREVTQKQILNLGNDIVSNENNSGSKTIEMNDQTSDENENNASNDNIQIAMNDISVEMTDEFVEVSTNVPEVEDEIEILDPEKAKEDIKELENVIETISKNVKQEYILPVSGDIIIDFAKDKLVFSETLNEWITHDGVDIMGEVAEPVKAAADGVVESVKMDPRYGNTIIIKHDDARKTVYSNLSTLELVYVGQKVVAGEIISGVGEGFGFESKEGPHVHFEIIENGQSINPIK